MSNNAIDENAYNVPHISLQLAEFLKEEFSADRQIAGGLLSDSNVIRSESYLLGFLAGLGLARQSIDVMLINQAAKAEEINLMAEMNSEEGLNFV